MSKMIKYPSTNQFRNIVKYIKHTSLFKGLDDDGNPIYLDAELDGVSFPTLAFKGTVKLHGSNGSIAYNDDEGFWAQSRNRVLNVGKDNAGFAAYVHHTLGETFIKSLFNEFSKYTKNNTVVIYGEWCGGNIQKGVGINGLEKMFVVFGVKVKPNDPEKDSFWIDFDKTLLSQMSLESYNFYSINRFKTYGIKIDFNKPEDFQNHLVARTEEVEKRCPVAAHFKPDSEEDLVGEGIVWSCFDEEKSLYHRFKVVGEKHSSSKVKKLAEVDPVKLKATSEFVAYAVTENRLQQGYDELFQQEPEMKHLGVFIKWVLNDIEKEEMDVLTESGLTLREVNSMAAKKIVVWFKNKLFS